MDERRQCTSDVEKTRKKTLPLMVIMLIVASVGLFFMLPGNQTNSTGKQVSYTNEEKLEQTLEAMQGVGKIKVYFYYGQMTADIDENNLFSQYFRSTDQNAKDITGMLIVSEGADDIFVKNEIRAVVSQVMQLPIHRIIIVPMEK